MPATRRWTWISGTRPSRFVNGFCPDKRRLMGAMRQALDPLPAAVQLPAAGLTIASGWATWIQAYALMESAG